MVYTRVNDHNKDNDASATRSSEKEIGDFTLRPLNVL